MAHPNKEIAAALKYAVEHGWKVEQGGSHAWGKMYCPHNSSDCRCGEFCIKSIWSTPKNATNHAKQLRRVVDNCIFNKSDNNQDDQPPVKQKRSERKKP